MRTASFHASRALLSASALAITMLGASAAGAQTPKPRYIAPKAAFTPKISIETGNVVAQNAPIFGGAGDPVFIAFEGISLYDTAPIGRGFVPPDTMGAVGTSQYASLINGGWAVWDKATGNRTQFLSDNQFWANAGIAFGGGQTTGGDPRLLFNSQANRWIAIGFGADIKDVNIAVSDTADALGPWKGTKFTGFDKGNFFDEIADYPTLSMDTNAIIIGTNNFGATAPGGARNFRGTTVNVLPLADIFQAGGPSVANLKQFETPFNIAAPNCAANDCTRGFAIQGVNSREMESKSHLVSDSFATANITRYDILNSGTAGATRTDSVFVGDGYLGNNPGRQPNLVPDVDLNPADSITSNDRIVDTLDTRIGTNAWEVNGKIYTLQTITQDLDNGNDPDDISDHYTRVRVTVIDSESNAVLDQVNVGEGTEYDYYMGSLAVNDAGQVVVGYNRSGDSTVANGRISVFAKAFITGGSSGKLFGGSEVLLKESLVDDYHTACQLPSGAIVGNDGEVGCGRQRWGDYSAVNLDPTDDDRFWVIGQFAREYNNAAGGHPGGNGRSRYGTWIAGVSFDNLAIAQVPEPETWAMMVLGFGFVGFGMRRVRTAKVTYA